MHFSKEIVLFLQILAHISNSWEDLYQITNVYLEIFLYFCTSKKMHIQCLGNKLFLRNAFMILKIMHISSEIFEWFNF